MAEEKLCPSCEEPVIDKYPACPLQCKSPRCRSYGPKAKIDYRLKPIIWILGGPGSGKGTQCDKIIKQYGFTHLSSGDLLRAEVKSGSKRGKELAAYMEKGQLVPNEIVLQLIKDAMAEKIISAKGFLIDGYPREQAQGIAFEQSIAPCSAIIYFDASLDVLAKRLMNRGLTSGRNDDNKETIKMRIQTFIDNNNGVLQQYPKKLIRINADRSVEEVYADVRKVMDPFVEGTPCSKN